KREPSPGEGTTKREPRSVRYGGITKKNPAAEAETEAGSSDGGISKLKREEKRDPDHYFGDQIAEREAEPEPYPGSSGQSTASSGQNGGSGGQRGGSSSHSTSSSGAKARRGAKPE